MLNSAYTFFKSIFFSLVSNKSCKEKDPSKVQPQVDIFSPLKHRITNVIFPKGGAHPLPNVRKKKHLITKSCLILTEWSFGKWFWKVCFLWFVWGVWGCVCYSAVFNSRQDVFVTCPSQHSICLETTVLIYEGLSSSALIMSLPSEAEPQSVPN